MKRFARIAPPVIWGVLFVFVWQLFVTQRRIAKSILPAPSVIWGAVTKFRPIIQRAAWGTALNALIGLLLGAIAGIAVAMIAQRFSAVREIVRPLASAFNTMPIVALGPIFYSIFGSTTELARRVVVALVAFFPVFVNALRGLTEVDRVHEELMRSYAASDTSFLTKVRVPNALPFAITGVRVASSLAVIAAVVVEYFGGLQNGLGPRVTSAATSGKDELAWAYVLAACLMGLLFFVAGVALERVAMPWQSRRAGADR